MALNIKDEEAHRLARELAAAKGGSLTEVVTDALRQALVRARSDNEGPRMTLLEELEEIALHCAALPRQEARSADEIIGYDQAGAPR